MYVRVGTRKRKLTLHGFMMKEKVFVWLGWLLEPGMQALQFNSASIHKSEIILIGDTQSGSDSHSVGKVLLYLGLYIYTAKCL